MMYISDVMKISDGSNHFEFTLQHYKWMIDLNNRPDLSMDHFRDADQWCVTNLPDDDFVIAPRKFFFRYLTDATLFRLIFS